MANEKRTAKAIYWCLVHLLFPMVPFITDTFIRYVTNDMLFSLNILSPEKLAICIGLLSIFVYQSILTRPLILPNDQDELDKNGACVLFLIYALISFGLFVAIVLLNGLNEFQKWNTLKYTKIFSITLYVISVLAIFSALIAQSSFKLKARI